MLTERNDAVRGLHVRWRLLTKAPEPVAQMAEQKSQESLVLHPFNVIDGSRSFFLFS